MVLYKNYNLNIGDDDLKLKSDYLIYCDESCPLEYELVTLLGAISCDYKNKEKIVKDLRKLKSEYFKSSRYETKWVKISNNKIEYYKKLIDYFYNNENISGRILVAKEKDKLNNKKYNNGDHQTWYYKMYYYLLDRFIDANYSYYILYDEKDKYTTYRMNTVKKIIENKKSFNKFSSFNLGTKQINSKESELMQLLDVIMGAVGYKNRGYMEKDKQTGQAKKEIVKYLESKFEKNIENGTSPYETKFNIFIWRPKKEVKYD